jgi:DNA invertase Pin-like site-specific DNA recombinase
MGTTTVGYARTSTMEQKAGFEAQLNELQAAGVEKIFEEQVSAVGERKELDKALDWVREGDTFLVTKLDRLARSLKHLSEIVDLLAEKNVTLRVLNIGLDTGTPTGKLMLNMLGSVAQFEREMMLERQREGIARAKSEGKYKGRPASICKKHVTQFLNQGDSVGAIQKKMSISRATVYRIKKEIECKKPSQLG